MKSFWAVNSPWVSRTLRLNSCFRARSENAQIFIALCIRLAAISFSLLEMSIWSGKRYGPAPLHSPRSRKQLSNGDVSENQSGDMKALPRIRQDLPQGNKRCWVLLFSELRHHFTNSFAILLTGLAALVGFDLFLGQVQRSQCRHVHLVDMLHGFVDHRSGFTAMGM